MAGTIDRILTAQQRKIVNAQQDSRGAIDMLQKRLASGRKVNSALDDPSVFFAARGLNYEALDAQKKLEEMGQSIQTIKTALDGIEYMQNQLDLGESFLLKTRQQMQTGEIVVVDTPVAAGGGGGTPPTVPWTPSNETPITFSGPGDFSSYAGSQDSGGGVTVSPDGTEFTISGNAWKRTAVNYTVTSDTVLVFEYQASILPEISAIGFDNDTNFSNSTNQFFLSGSQTGGVTYAAPISQYRTSTTANHIQYEIPIGAFFTGNFSHMTFFNDHDGGARNGTVSFQNIVLREGPEETPPPPSGPSTPIDPVIEQGLIDEYTQILDTYDGIIFDASYRGTRLLEDDDLVTDFNDSQTSSLTTTAINATTADLSLDRTGLDSIAAINNRLDEVRAARIALRSYAAALTTDLTIIQSRETFTKNIVNNFLQGSDKLTMDDQNETSALLLSMSTRQQLQINALSIASQAPVLSLF